MISNDLLDYSSLDPATLYRAALNRYEQNLCTFGELTTYSLRIASHLAAAGISDPGITHYFTLSFRQMVREKEPAYKKRAADVLQSSQTATVVKEPKNVIADVASALISNNDSSFTTRQTDTKVKALASVPQPTISRCNNRRVTDNDVSTNRISYAQNDEVVVLAKQYDKIDITGQYADNHVDTKCDKLSAICADNAQSPVNAEMSTIITGDASYGASNERSESITESITTPTIDAKQSFRVTSTHVGIASLRVNVSNSCIEINTDKSCSRYEHKSSHSDMFTTNINISVNSDADTNTVDLDRDKDVVTSNAPEISQGPILLLESSQRIPHYNELSRDSVKMTEYEHILPDVSFSGIVHLPYGANYHINAAIKALSGKYVRHHSQNTRNVTYIYEVPITSFIIVTEETARTKLLIKAYTTSNSDCFDGKFECFDMIRFYENHYINMNALLFNLSKTDNAIIQYDDINTFRAKNKFNNYYESTVRPITVKRHLRVITTFHNPDVLDTITRQNYTVYDNVLLELGGYQTPLFHIDGFAIETISNKSVSVPISSEIFDLLIKSNLSLAKF